MSVNDRTQTSISPNVPRRKGDLGDIHIYTMSMSPMSPMSPMSHGHHIWCTPQIYHTNVPHVPQCPPSSGGHGGHRNTSNICNVPCVSPLTVMTLFLLQICHLWHSYYLSTINLILLCYDSAKTFLRLHLPAPVALFVIGSAKPVAFCLS